ncbi:MAG: universal stress protein [Reichenbachiella sp.]|uniref:universal stress protein n=1 Tax=Reichenbachiella sp. TaxID=2184521 RepID=UPI0029666A2E|nr:universal stress protein [Reichenbachiella sp.]MDW3210266.1 universal stress protein [Reichenbachiella sp.]
MRISKILVPIDFSRCSINALKIATEIATKQGAKIEIVNAFHVPAYAPMDVMAVDLVNQPMFKEEERKVKDEFKSLPSLIPQLKDVSYSTKVFMAPAADAIYQCTEQDDIDLIVMGTKGEHDVVENLFGSMSAQVIKSADVPVLVVPENVESFDLKHIGFAADLHEIENMNRLGILSLLAKMYDSEINIFHISEENDEESISEAARERMFLEGSLKDIKHTFATIYHEEPIEGIMEFAERKKLDLLAMYPRQHGFWDKLVHGSTTKKVVMQIKIPLLTIHE